MIVVFDLDDTLYPEHEYVVSGFRAVAAELRRRWGVDEGEATEVMLRSERERGRGTQLDDVVTHFGLRGRQSVPALVSLYRHHDPAIELPAESRRVLDSLGDRPLYLVTDGHKVVQARKIEALGIEPRFRHCYLTHRYGIRSRKPSPRVFELITSREGAFPGEIVHVADDPSKDFVGIRPLGFRTIRVRTGRHAATPASSAESAEHEVERLSQVVPIVRRLEAEGRE